ncbi:hypothetical protein M378DRAFT_183079 [Amanita muscaria Koide BX008]|uniref:Uncharacterized protein n=1 Tax=Amanita muscaria (strain Koide BX008) TaxID=946122 RepID=A0A0C2XBC9_AMAMK|nr:hypothetical protein M378DRAFT_183079 [Amanita muscaria Koide BX008]
MSFQHFRLGDISLQQSASSASLYQSPIQPDPGKSLPSSSHTKQPYGSGDSDDGYTLVFPTIAAFQEWRAAEEERQMVEFGDTHGSKAIPPRFKDHTKLVCARHSRSGRKKYVKKYPDRVRKVPSRKLEGVGCPASISYKTYFDTEEVRVCYSSQHSHPIGTPNLPFTRRGRKAVVLQEKERRNRTNADSGSDLQASTSAQPSASTQPNTPNHEAAVSTVAQPVQPEPPAPPLPQTTTFPVMAPQVQNTFQPSSSSLAYASTVPSQSYIAPQNVSHERWENMAILFHNIRENARTMEYSSASVAALESVLLRLYLETPLNFGSQPSTSAIMQHLAAQARAASSSGVSNPDGSRP